MDGALSVVIAITDLSKPLDTDLVISRSIREAQRNMCEAPAAIPPGDVILRPGTNFRGPDKNIPASACIGERIPFGSRALQPTLTQPTTPVLKVPSVSLTRSRSPG